MNPVEVARGDQLIARFRHAGEACGVFWRTARAGGVPWPIAALSLAAVVRHEMDMEAAFVAALDEADVITIWDDEDI